jgi:hypothetical protein
MLNGRRCTRRPFDHQRDEMRLDEVERVAI